MDITDTAKLVEVADMFEMYVNQIREHVNDKDNELPWPTVMENWMERYKTIYCRIYED